MEQTENKTVSTRGPSIGWPLHAPRLLLRLHKEHEGVQKKIHPQNAADRAHNRKCGFTT